MNGSSRTTQGAKFVIRKHSFLQQIKTAAYCFPVWHPQYLKYAKEMRMCSQMLQRADQMFLLLRIIRGGKCFRRGCVVWTHSSISSSSLLPHSLDTSVCCVCRTAERPVWTQSSYFYPSWISLFCYLLFHWNLEANPFFTSYGSQVCQHPLVRKWQILWFNFILK